MILYRKPGREIEQASRPPISWLCGLPCLRSVVAQQPRTQTPTEHPSIRDSPDERGAGPRVPIMAKFRDKHPVSGRPFDMSQYRPIVETAQSVRAARGPRRLLSATMLLGSCCPLSFPPSLVAFFAPASNKFPYKTTKVPLALSPYG